MSADRVLIDLLERAAVVLDPPSAPAATSPLPPAQRLSAVLFDAARERLTELTRFDGVWPSEAPDDEDDEPAGMLSFEVPARPSLEDLVEIAVPFISGPSMRAICEQIRDSGQWSE